MVKRIITLSSIMILLACNNTSHKATKAPLLGGQKDTHGCLTSAGETWSELKQHCLQVFNEGQRLNPVDTPKNKAII